MKRAGIILLLILFMISIAAPMITSGSFIVDYDDPDSNDHNEIESIRGSTRASKPTGNGPYSTSFVTIGMPRENNSAISTRIYYPAVSGNVSPIGAPYPGIVFAPGAGGTETSYGSVLRQLASWGYIVAIVGTGGPCNQEVVDTQSDVLNYYEEQNSNPSSIFYNKISSSGYGASGHSNGGWAAIAGAVADSRFKGVSPLCAAAGPNYDTGQANTNNLHVPLQLVSGAQDSTYLPSSDAYYNMANSIKSYIKLEGSGHGGPFHLEYTVSFFKVWLENDFNYSTYIYGKDVEKDVEDNKIQYTSEVGLEAVTNPSEVSLDECEMFEYTGDGLITEPSGPNRYIALYEWDLESDGQYDTNYSIKPSKMEKLYMHQGLFSMTFRVTDSWGFTATTEMTIEVSNKRPIAHAGLDQKGYEDELVSFDANQSTDTFADMWSGLQYRWEFGDGEITNWLTVPYASHIYTSSGNYTASVQVKDDDDDLDSDAVLITIQNTPPKAVLQIDQSSVNIDEIVNYDASLSYDTTSDNDTLQYYWNFGDSIKDQGITTSHSYKEEGSYNVTLVVMDNDNDQDTSWATINVLNSAPSCTAMTDKQINEDEIVQFSGEGRDTKIDQDSLLYSWHFGIPGVPDSPWSPSPEFEFRYKEEGDYIAILTVKDDDGATASDFVQIQVTNIKPTAKFSVSGSKVSEDEQIIFDASLSEDTSSDFDSLNYSWDLFDGSPIKYGKLVQYRFDEGDAYIVQLTVTDNNGDTDSYSRKIEVVNEPPIAVIGASTTETYTDTEISFNAYDSTDTPTDLEGLLYGWDFGDDLHGQGIAVTHSFDEPGKYEIILKVTDGDAESTETITIRILESVELAEESTDNESRSSNNVLVSGATVFIIILLIVLMLLSFFYLKTKRSISPKPKEYIHDGRNVPNHGSAEVYPGGITSHRQSNESKAETPHLHSQELLSIDNDIWPPQSRDQPPSTITQSKLNLHEPNGKSVLSEQEERIQLNAGSLMKPMLPSYNGADKEPLVVKKSNGDNDDNLEIE